MVRLEGTAQRRMGSVGECEARGAGRRGPAGRRGGGRQLRARTHTAPLFTNTATRRDEREPVCVPLSTVPPSLPALFYSSLVVWVIHIALRNPCHVIAIETLLSTKFWCCYLIPMLFYFAELNVSTLLTMLVLCRNLIYTYLSILYSTVSWIYSYTDR